MRGLEHINLRAPAAAIARLRRFYTGIIGLKEGPRPAFHSGSRGYWLYAGGRAVLHLTIGADDGTTPQPPGPFNHFAFDCEDLAAMRAHLDAAGIKYRTDVVDALGQTQLFLMDPAGVALELTFQTAAGQHAAIR